MKRFLNMMAVCCTVALIGCSTTSSNAPASPGAVGECGMGKKECKGECSKPCGGMENRKCAPDCDKPCCADKNTNMGAMGDDAGFPNHCKGMNKEDCEGKVCPMSGKKKGHAGASLGALGADSPSGCSKKKADSDTNLGAVSDKASSAALPPCCKNKASKGSS